MRLRRSRLEMDCSERNGNKDEDQDEASNRNRRKGPWRGSSGREGEGKEDMEVKKTVLKLNDVEI